MAIVSTGLTTNGIEAALFERMRQTPTYYQDLCTRFPSTTGIERHRWMGSVPPMRKWGTGRQAKGMFSEAYDVENMKYEITLEVDRDELSDDQTSQISLRVQELAEKAVTHKDSEIARLLVNGHSAGYLSYDGVPFFSTLHASGESGNQDNTIPAAVATDPNNPTSAEFRLALGSAIAKVLSFKDDQGQPRTQTGAGLVAVIPPSMYMSALEAVNATLVASTTNVLQGAARIIALPHLTAADVFYVLKTDQAVRPFLFQDREPIEFTALEADSDEGFKREKYLYDVRARYRIAYALWQFAVKVTFT